MSYRKSSWKNKKARQQANVVREPDVSSDIGDTNLQHKDVKIYLVKMPAFLAEHFESNDEAHRNEIVGRLRILKGDGPVKGQQRETARIFLDKVKKPSDDMLLGAGSMSTGANDSGAKGAGGKGLQPPGDKGMQRPGGKGLPPLIGKGLPPLGGKGLPPLGGKGLPPLGGKGLPPLGGKGLPPLGGKGLPPLGSKGAIGKGAGGRGLGGKGLGGTGSKDVKNDITTEFDLQFLEDAADSKIMVFSGNRKGDDVDMRIEGNVSYQCVARPKLDRTYRDMNKRRTLLSMQKSREVLRMDDSARKAVDREAIQPMSMTETTKQREERKQKKEDSRRHLDVPDEKWREIARVAVFKAFEIQSHYSAEELAAVVEEPVTRLRRVITEVCAYNNSGPFSGRYELKDEFKTVSQRRQKERELEDYRLEQVEIAKKRREERAERERSEGPPSKKARQM